MNTKQIARKKRAFRVRKKLFGTAARPRLSIHKSNKHIILQLIDDEKGCTLAAVSTLSKSSPQKKSRESARLLGKSIAQMALEKNISTVVFDRGFHAYTGIVEEAANAARSEGLIF